MHVEEYWAAFRHLSPEAEAVLGHAVDALVQIEPDESTNDQQPATE